MDCNTACGCSGNITFAVKLSCLASTLLCWGKSAEADTDVVSICSIYQVCINKPNKNTHCKFAFDHPRQRLTYSEIYTKLICGRRRNVFGTDRNLTASSVYPRRIGRGFGVKERERRLCSVFFSLPLRPF